MNGLVYLLYLALMLYAWLIIARALLSWFRVRPGSSVDRVRRVLVAVTEPYLAVFRRVIPVARFGGAGIDVSSIVALLVLFGVMQILVRL